MAGAAFHKGDSRQDYETPPAFVRAVEAKIGRVFEWDLAATNERVSKAPNYIAPPGSGGAAPKNFLLRETVDSLPLGVTCWLNPPFGRMAPWVAQMSHCCAASRVGVLLAPAAVGSEWFARWVWPHAHVIFLRPRIAFVGETHGYPKDLMLAVYDRAGALGLGAPSSASLWRWDGA